MKFKTLTRLLVSSSFVSITLLANIAQAQVSSTDEANDEALTIDDDASLTDGNEEDIVVIGSRLKAIGTSSSPTSVIDLEDRADVGEFDLADITQQSGFSNGVQIDSSFQAFINNNGPGSQTANLRAAGAGRTLLLINGRRLAPAGVEGAPTEPSLNLLPSSLIGQAEFLLDGASSVYGSDAVAGVINYKLRQNFNGPELSFRGNFNEQGGGDDYTITGAWGKNFSRGNFGIGFEYNRRDTVTIGERGFTSGCETPLELGSDGSIRTTDINEQFLGQERTPGIIIPSSPCLLNGGSVNGLVNIPFTSFGNIIFTPGSTNIGIPNFGETNFSGIDLDIDGDGVRDVDLNAININGQDQSQTLIPEQDRFNIAAYGEYTFDGSAEITPYFEFNYVNSTVITENFGAQRRTVAAPDNNPFNPCNVDIPTGVDCFAAAANLAVSLGVTPPFFAFTGSAPVDARFSIAGDGDNFRVDQEQYRGVFGIKGKLPFLGDSWDFDVSGVYSRAIGNAVRRGIREDRLAFALGIDPTIDFNDDGIIDNNGTGIADDVISNVDFFVNPTTFFFGIFDLSIGGGNPGGIGPITPCDASALQNPDFAAPDLTAGCVPVNIFAPSVLGQVRGSFATQAETDFLFDDRTFRTIYEQITLSAFVRGDLINLPAGPVSAVFGIEFRDDIIDSVPDLVAAEGLLLGAPIDRGAVASKNIKEAYAELRLPILGQDSLLGAFNLELAGRLIDEEIYGTNGTYAIKANWSPDESLLFRFTYGTSFRAPNLRENFLAEQSNLAVFTDPCAVPIAAVVGGVFDPASDDRDPVVLQICSDLGRDPTTIGSVVDPTGLIVSNNTDPIVIVRNGGSLDLDPETSRSITFGGVYTKRIFADINFRFEAGYHDIVISDAIVENSALGVLNQCFSNTGTGVSSFCDLIEFNETPGSDGLITEVNAVFSNFDRIQTRGMDFNANFNKQTQLFGRQFNFNLSVQANRLIERSQLQVNFLGDINEIREAGTIGFPEWTGRASFRASTGSLGFSWAARYIGPTEVAELSIDPFDDLPGTLGTGFNPRTCTGNGTANVPSDGIFCRAIGFTTAYFVHNMSASYSFGAFSITGGVSNIFNNSPPLVDPGEATTIANVPIGSRFDLNGREYFISLRARF